MKKIFVCSDRAKRGFIQIQNQDGCNLLMDMLINCHKPRYLVNKADWLDQSYKSYFIYSRVAIIF